LFVSFINSILHYYQNFTSKNHTFRLIFRSSHIAFHKD
jgi:hypothetical protein